MSIICESPRFIFIHVPKTGGMTVRHALITQVPGSHGIISRHANFKRVQLGVGLEFAYVAYKFAFVRNPWDRMVSWYSMIQRVPEAKKAKNAAKYGLPHPFTFEQAIRGATKDLLHSQMDYICDYSGHLRMDSVFYFEHFASEMERLGESLGVKFKTVPKLNASPHAHYSTYYTKELREIVAERFARDIQTFGYKFEQ